MESNNTLARGDSLRMPIVLLYFHLPNVSGIIATNYTHYQDPLPQRRGGVLRKEADIPMNSPTNPVYTFEFTVPESAVDENRHVNNVQFVQWMQDAAVRHYGFIGGIELTQTLGATWVVRSHNVEYLRPAYAGEQIEVSTWVVNIRRVRSLRRYRFARVADGKLLVKGETDWIFVDAQTGAPRTIPEEIIMIFPLLPDSMGS
jgi:acyl-CoA thioester hydrolase